MRGMNPCAEMYPAQPGIDINDLPAQRLVNAPPKGKNTIRLRSGSPSRTAWSISQESSSGMSSSLSGYPGMPEQINDQVFVIVAVQGDEGVLRLSK
jgi:hypothetical protein